MDKISRKDRLFKQDRQYQAFDLLTRSKAKIKDRDASSYFFFLHLQPKRRLGLIGRSIRSVPVGETEIPSERGSVDSLVVSDVVQRGKVFRRELDGLEVGDDSSSGNRPGKDEKGKEGGGMQVRICESERRKGRRGRERKRERETNLGRTMQPRWT